MSPFYYKSKIERYLYNDYQIQLLVCQSQYRWPVPETFSFQEVYDYIKIFDESVLFFKLLIAKITNI